jgi:uncharacterized protein YqcC (DUF446 family)
VSGAIPAPAAYGELADRIEAELLALGLWGAAAPVRPVSTAFGAPELSFAQWLEHVLCPRLRDIARGRGDPPSHSQVSTRAARELDGIDHSDRLHEALSELDALVNG